MKKFILGIIASLGVYGVGKVCYNKGRQEQAKEDYNYFDAAIKGLSIGMKSKEESE